MPAPRWLARLNLHLTNRLLGPVARYLPGMGVVIHVGRKSRRVYRTPVLIFRRGEQLVIALTYGRDSEWVQNVLANGGCDCETERHILRLVHPYLFHDDRRAVMPAFVRFVLGVLNVSDFLELTIADGIPSR